MQIVSTDASPSPALSFAHFLAGLGGMLAAAALLAWEPAAVLTRWHPATLAAVHLFALAGLMPVMLGALFQFVPVACGLSLARFGIGDWLLLAALEAGACGLAAGFLGGNTALLASSGTLALATLTLAGGRLAWALWRQQHAAELLTALRRSALALAATLLLAAVLLSVMRLGGPLPFMALVDWHAQWGMAGWVGGLIAAVAGVVVPMFHVTAHYPARWESALRMLPLLLAASGLGLLLGLPWLSGFAVALLALLVAGFGGLTLRLLAAARRGEKDAFHFGWLGVALIALLLAPLALLAQHSPDPRWGFAFGVMALTGLGGITVSVMLFRIVPFLIWLHWQRANKARAKLPLLHQIIPETGQSLQLAAEALAVMLLAAAAFFPDLAQPAALLLLCAKLGQIALLGRAMHGFHQRLRLLRSLPPKIRPPAAGVQG